jgi:hypothetical protein
MPVSAALTAIEDRVRENIKRGTAFDTRITAKVKDAVTWIEQNYNLPHMKLSSTFQIAAGSNVLSLAFSTAYRIKRIRAVWWEEVSEDSQETLKYPITRIDEPDLFDVTPGGNPTVYWYDSLVTSIAGQLPRFLVNTAPEADINGKWTAWVYSIAPGAADSFNYRASEFAYQNAALIEALTMLRMAPILRNDALVPEWRPIFEECLRTLLIASDDFQQGDRYNEEMSYIPEY